LPIGEGEIRRQSHARPGGRIAILAFGSMLAPALEVGARLDATVANMRFVKPIDVALVAQLARDHDALVTVEENVVAGGAGSACAEALASTSAPARWLQLGLPDRFVDHGDVGKLLAGCGLNADGIEASIRQRFPETVRDARRVKSVA
jgi:1-deoxy-D-xylulose-5-phosphate synthase